MSHRVNCNCGNDTWHVDVTFDMNGGVEVNGEVVCTACELRKEIGRDTPGTLEAAVPKGDVLAELASQGVIDITSDDIEEHVDGLTAQAFVDQGGEL